jgi:U4/U6.U5 tri-snRNP component SNU23
LTHLLLNLTLQEGTDDPALDARKRKRLENDPLHQGLIVQRANLKARDQQIDLASNLHRSTVHSVTAPLSQQAGFYCDVCDCVLKDSMAYLDHINGKWHNRALGMSMVVEKSTADQVRKRLEEAKRRKKLGGGNGNNKNRNEEDELEEHIPDGMDKERLKKENDAIDSDEEDEIQEGEGAGRLPVETTNNVDDEEGVDPDFAAMMGFGGFGGSKKG